MDVKEKLVELSDIQVLQREIECVKRKSYTNCTDCFNCDLLMTDERILSAYANAIDALQNANGVTVQEWISVDDKLPEVVSIHQGYRSTVKKSIRVLCVCVQKSGKTMVKEGYCEWYNDYQAPRWKIPGTIDEVTHWQYLPQPPKGE